MKRNVAVLLDGGYVRYELSRLLRRQPSADEIEELAHKCYYPQEEDLFRIYYYDCQPADNKTIHPGTKREIDFSQTPGYEAGVLFYQDLAIKNRIAYRSGHLKFRGWKIDDQAIRDYFDHNIPIKQDDVVPNFQQKGVDIKIGLDISWLASRNVVDRVILFTGDTDFVPAMKYARREGVQVVTAALRDTVRPEFKEHSDEFRLVDYP